MPDISTIQATLTKESDTVKKLHNLHSLRRDLTDKRTKRKGAARADIQRKLARLSKTIKSNGGSSVEWTN